MKPLRVACFGEAMIELRLEENGRAVHSTAGDTLNTAVYLKRAAKYGIDVEYITALGVDGFSEVALQEISAYGLNTRYLRQHPTKPIGLYGISNDEYGERSFVYWRSQSASREFFNLDGELPKETDLFMFSGVSLAILNPADRERLFELALNLRSSGTLIAFDPNYRPSLWASRNEAINAINSAWRITDIALPSFSDENELFGDTNPSVTRNRIMSLGPSRGVVKCGSEGPLSFTSRTPSALYVVDQVVDATGAGDAFNGVYLARILEGSSENEAMSQAHDVSASVLTIKGAIA